MRRPERPRSGLRGDPLLVTLVVLLAACTLWLTFADQSILTRLRVFWLVQLPLDATLSVLSCRVGLLASGRIRRFWLTLGASAGLWCAGDAVQSVIVLADPARAAISGGVQMACVTLGTAALVVVMLLHPKNANRTARQRLAYWLDAATVVIGGAVVAWAFVLNTTGATTTATAETLVGIAMLLAALYAAVKMSLSDCAPVTRTAAAPMILAVVVQAIGAFAVPSRPHTIGSPGLMVLRLLPSFLILAGPRIQELQARANPGVFVRDQRKPYSLLPYASIAGIFAVLVVILPGGVTARLWGVVAGLAVVTALVLARQLVTFHDNVDLIGRLDQTLVDLRSHEKLLFEQASFDALTGLANRAAFGKDVADALNALGAHDAAGSDRGLALLLIDLDDFKTVNDTLGHSIGDALLVVVAGLLRTCLPETARMARTGGDEFAVLLFDTAEEQATRAAERVLACLARPVRVEQHELLVRGTIGLAVAAPGDDAGSLLRNADIAMHEAKSRGKGGHVRYTPDMAVGIRKTAELAYRLHEALGTGQFFLLYQPIVRLADGHLIGAEALVRWRHPEVGLLSPAEFIPVAEHTGMIVQIGRWVLREACRQAAAWRAEHPEAEHLVVNVNVAGRQLREPGFVDEVAGTLADFDLPPANLTIEITENAVLDDEAAIAALYELRELGVRLALDDFGTGASSLGLLLTCPVTSLKLDRSFVDEITTVDRQAAVATAVIEMANALNLTAVAEGVETPEQAALLREQSYEYAQGYLFARPLTAEALASTWVRARRRPAAEVTTPTTH